MHVASHSIPASLLALDGEHNQLKNGYPAQVVHLREKGGSSEGHLSSAPTLILCCSSQQHLRLYRMAIAPASSREQPFALLTACCALPGGDSLQQRNVAPVLESMVTSCSAYSDLDSFLRVRKWVNCTRNVLSIPRVRQ